MVWEEMLLIVQRVREVMISATAVNAALYYVVTDVKGVYRMTWIVDVEG